MPTIRLPAASTLVLLLGLVSAASAQDADASRRWRLHCIAVSGDLSEPADILLFRRCLAQAPAGVATQSPAPVVNPFAKNPLVVTTTPVPLTNGPVSLTNSPVSLTNSCPQGLARRDAAPDDTLCVPLAIRRRTLQENVDGASRVVPGSQRCLSGFVWREATRSDRVCVQPAIRARVASENAMARR